MTKVSAQRRGVLYGVLGAVAALGLLVLLLVVLCWHVSANDHARIERDRAVKIACIQAGKSLVGGNCVPIATK